MISKKQTSWGRYPNHPQTAHITYWRNELYDSLKQVITSHDITLPFGNGRSYGDSCYSVSDNVMSMRTLDRFISVDWKRGIIIAESGITLEEVLALSIPNGWFLPVTPGTKYVTLGGAIANDVHGKNHHVRGTFGCHVPRFGLIRSDREPVVCSLVENNELYTATIGGLGVTGLIDWVEIQLIPIQSNMIECTTIRFNSLSDFFALTEEFDQSHEYTVAWVDCQAKGASSGRGVFFIGEHSKEGNLEVVNKQKLSMPFTPPISAINKLSLRLFNISYYHIHESARKNKRVSYEPFFYPLDGILHWNRIYGSKGFQQYQCVIPDSEAERATQELLEVVALSGNGSFLAVMKKCGDIVSPGLLSFPLPGVSLALDFPQNDGLNSLLFPHMDKIVCEAGGRIYPAKDAHMLGKDFRQFYPQWEQVEELRDPTLCSRFWKRVTQI